MADLEVYKDSSTGKWVVEHAPSGNVWRRKKKKDAVNKAEGLAQQKANSSHRTKEIHVYSSKNQYQRSINVSPTH